jgi:hypothetical protein
MTAVFVSGLRLDLDLRKCLSSLVGLGAFRRAGNFFAIEQVPRQ